MGGQTNDPKQNPLRLLPSGSDRVSEQFARSQPPRVSIADFGGGMASSILINKQLSTIYYSSTTKEPTIPVTDPRLDSENI